MYKRSIQNFYKIVIFFLITSFVICAFCSCSGSSDWTFDLPNGYKVVRTNYKTVHLISPEPIKITETTKTTIITGEMFVSEFAYNDIFIVVKCINLPENIKKEEINDFIANADVIYGVIKSDCHQFFLDLRIDEYNVLVESLEIQNLSPWIETVCKPENAY